MKTTPLHDFHVRNAKTMEFAGYDMPLWYTGIVDEHLAVRNSSGIFDVSHMGRAFIRGPDAGRFLDSLVPTVMASQPTGKAIYTLLMNEAGGIHDDFIALKISDQEYQIVVNAANTAKDLAHVREMSRGFDVSIDDFTQRSAMFAIQGPTAQKALQPLTAANLGELKRFKCVDSAVRGARSTVSRTGYTGEDGFEVIIYDVTNSDPVKATRVWDELVKVSKPCGLGARDSLRIEAGYPLYGSEIDETTNPIEADLGWVVSPEKRDYVGSAAVQRALATGTDRVRRGIVLDEKIPRSHFEVMDPEGHEIGAVTSGTFSPILKKGIAMGLVAKSRSDIGSEVMVRVRDSSAPGHLVRPPFYDERLYGWKRQGNGK